MSQFNVYIDKLTQIFYWFHKYKLYKTHSINIHISIQIILSLSDSCTGIHFEYADKRTSDNKLSNVSKYAKTRQTPTMDQ
jgi:hypothetical protein